MLTRRRENEPEYYPVGHDDRETLYDPDLLKCKLNVKCLCALRRHW